MTVTSYDITVVIPSIAERTVELRRAFDSVGAQTLKLMGPVGGVVISSDTAWEGSAVTRNRGLQLVKSPWTAFLDDDDEFLPHHLETLARTQELTDADVVYTWPRVLLNGQPVPRQWDWGGPTAKFDPELLRRKAYIQTTCLVRTDLAVNVGGFKFVMDSTGALNDDHGFFLALLNAGAKFACTGEETFLWNHWAGNTSGQPSRRKGPLA